MSLYEIIAKRIRVDELTRPALSELNYLVEKAQGLTSKCDEYIIKEFGMKTYDVTMLSFHKVITGALHLLSRDTSDNDDARGYCWHIIENQLKVAFEQIHDIKKLSVPIEVFALLAEAERLLYEAHKQKKRIDEICKPADKDED